MPKIADEMKSRNAMESLSRSRSKAKDEFGKDSGRDSRGDRKGNSSSNYYQSDPVPHYYGKKEEDFEKRSNSSRRSSKRGFKPPKKEIIGMNTFSNNSPHRYLHFFQHDENLLHYLDLDEGTEFQAIPININQTLPDFHKSISVSTGDLFLIGGANASSP